MEDGLGTVIFNNEISVRGPHPALRYVMKAGIIILFSVRFNHISSPTADCQLWYDELYDIWRYYTERHHICGQSAGDIQYFCCPTDSQ